MPFHHRPPVHLPGALLLALAAAAAAAQPSPSRGELLYATHCVACHTSERHWRDKRQAVDWASLRQQVRLWQASALLGWSEDDIGQVTRHLNDSFYGFDPSEEAGVTGRPATGMAWPGAPRGTGAAFTSRPMPTLKVTHR